VRHVGYLPRINIWLRIGTRGGMLLDRVKKKKQRPKGNCQFFWEDPVPWS